MSASVDACPACLRRSHLIAFLAPRIAGLLDRPRRRVPGLLALGDEELIAAVAGPRREAAEAFVEDFDHRRAEHGLEESGIAAACPHGDAYPRALRDLDDPPAVLYFTGDRRRLETLTGEPAVAVVGSRRPSPYGLEMGYALGRGIGAAGLTVVSGLALGVDAAAHRGCLEGRGAPLAVLAGGPDVPYPSHNRRLYERVRRHGAVMSEMPPGRRAFRWSFPARNRLMAGLARMTVVVEAAQPSGSLITAEFAQDLGRVVGAVPGHAGARMAAGTNALLCDGARLVSGPGDVLDELLGAGAADRSTCDEADALDPVARAVLDAVEGGQTVAGVCREAGLPAGTVRATLARLEAEGLVVPGRVGQYQRALPARSA